MDLLIINPPSQGYDGLGGLPAIEPPVLVGMAAGSVRAGRVGILDAAYGGLTVERTAALALAQTSDTVIVQVGSRNPSGSTQHMPAAIELCRRLKGHVRRLGIAGLHPTALPDRTHAETGAEVLGVLPRGRAIWHLMPPARYRAHNWHCFGYKSRSPYAAIYTAFGCPFKCSFCCIHALWPKYTVRPVDDVVAELTLLKEKYGVRHVKICDELFVLDRKRVQEICEKIRHLKLNLWAYARVNTVTPQLLQQMKRAGFNWLAYGFESACELVRNGVGKGTTDQQAEDAIHATRDAGINIIANFIFGLPDDDLYTMRRTFDWGCNHNFEFANLYCAMAYPGSALYDQAVKEGWRLPDTWAGYAQLGYETFPLDTKYIRGEQVLKFRDAAFQAYFSRPEYKGMIEAKFGTPARAEIDLMLKHRIPRKHLERQET